MRTNWLRVTRRHLCRICGKSDWCTFSTDGRVAICMREESNRPTKNGGWLHHLTGDEWTPPSWRKITRKTPSTQLDCVPIHERCLETIRPRLLRWLSNNLCVSIEALERFEVGYHTDKKVYSMPMRRADGSICGIKYPSKARTQVL